MQIVILEKDKPTGSSLFLDSFGFPNERLDKEVFPHWPGRVTSHRLLGESGLHGVVQASSCTFGVDFKSPQPLRLHARNGPGQKQADVY